MWWAGADKKYGHLHPMPGQSRFVAGQ
jgi:hypothetical protein